MKVAGGEHADDRTSVLPLSRVLGALPMIPFFVGAAAAWASPLLRCSCLLYITANPRAQPAPCPMTVAAE